MYKCYFCGAIVDEDEYEHLDGDCPNPRCCGSLEKAKDCKVCGEPFLSECGESVCDICLKEYATVDLALKFTTKRDCTETIEINEFLANMFSREEIERILTRELKEAEKIYPPIYKEKAVEYLMEDLGWYADLLDEEVNGGK